MNNARLTNKQVADGLVELAEEIRAGHCPHNKVELNYFRNVRPIGWIVAIDTDATVAWGSKQGD